MAVPKATSRQELWDVIQQTPIIDHHAHPLLKPQALEKHPLLAIATEAHGNALDASKQTLAHFRAVKQLSAKLHCPPTWESVEEAIDDRRASDYDQWTKECLAGIQCVLVDDGLDNEADAESYTHFNQHTSTPAKRIVRIEQIAAKLITHACTEYEDHHEALEAFLTTFKAVIITCIRDEEVVGFKSVICYRTGLNIRTHVPPEEVRAAFGTIYKQFHESKSATFTRLQHRALNETIVLITAACIRDEQCAFKKPFQFHTGLGDNDIILTLSSPAHMQNFVRYFKTVPVVLLHSGYPYVRDAGYLATMYANVCIDIGEVFPFLSRDGQLDVIRETLHLSPFSKVLWSTDGHWFPETYWLAVEQMRDAAFVVLCEYVQKGDLSWTQAGQFVQDLLFNNSNAIYDLGLRLKPLEKSHALRPAAQETDHALISRYLAEHPETQHLKICFSNLTGTLQTRIVTRRHLLEIIEDGGKASLNIAACALGVMQNNTVTPPFTPTGQITLQPDLNWIFPSAKANQAFVMGNFKQEDGSIVAECPRSALQTAINHGEQNGLTFLVGFEIEFILLRRDQNGELQPIKTAHHWGRENSLNQDDVENAIEDALGIIDKAGILVETFHAEAASGQYEIVLGKAPPLEAVDKLLFAHSVLDRCSTKHGFKFTLHPRPFANQGGTAAHMHLSVSSSNGASGILKHLRAICAFTLSNISSYERVLDGLWTGGTWVAWGTHNKDVPLRKVSGSHWEVKCVDGIANPYLATAALLQAGMAGIGRNEKLTLRDCTEQVADCSVERRTELGIVDRMPASLQEALDALKSDEELVGLLGQELVTRYCAVKVAEMQTMLDMNDDDRRTWLLEHY
ncbi:hypothetical protein Golomagni_05504 [Golovinomyces magnicellulatus]|nr:hypothetical protein Golomagni_05504 [Golovinomyces magnicellulatus]